MGTCYIRSNWQFIVVVFLLLYSILSLDHKMREMENGLKGLKKRFYGLVRLGKIDARDISGLDIPTELFLELVDLKASGKRRQAINKLMEASSLDKKESKKFIDGL